MPPMPPGIEEDQQRINASLIPDGPETPKKKQAPADRDLLQ